ncbi:AAA family ATPase [Arthrobacter sp. NPDC058097]|uniref:AAA family ATPase n=1 Tax=Arthrobacter sp. NPDC058097 TaxID=3346340 RepID=UPI0036DEFA09
MTSHSSSSRVYAKLANSARVQLQRISISTSPVFVQQEVTFGQLTAVAGCHGAGKSYLLKVVEESLPSYGDGSLPLPPGRRPWSADRPAEDGAVIGEHVVFMGNGWEPRRALVDLSVPQPHSFRYEEAAEELSITQLLSAHRAFGEYSMWMQESFNPKVLYRFADELVCDRDTLESINRILGREYASVHLKSFQHEDFSAPWISATMADGTVRTAFEMSSGELWVLFCVWELQRSNPTDVVLIDEPESYLSPRGHSAFIDEIARQTLSRGFQTIVATHSEAMIRRVPSSLLRFAAQSREGTTIRSGVGHDDVMAALGYEEAVRFVALVEDSLARDILQRIFTEFAKEHGRSWDIVPCGGVNEAVRATGLLGASTRLTPLLVLDGDQRSSGRPALYLPGQLPEHSILSANPEVAADRLGVPVDKFETAVALTAGVSHQQVFFEIARYLALPESLVRHALIATWLMEPEIREQAQELVRAAEAIVTSATPAP